MADRYASLKQGLVGAWIPSISGSGLLLPDLSGRGNNGTLTNMAADDWVSSGDGRALDFDGSNDYVDCGNMLNTGVFLNLTVSCFIYLTSSKTYFPILEKYQGAVTSNGFAIFGESAIGYTFGGRESVAAFLQSGPSGAADIQVGSWVHLLGRKLGTTWSIWVNGVLKNSQSAGVGTTSINNTTRPLQIAGSTIDLAFAAAIIDDVRIYNRALSEPEIRLLSSEPGIGFKPAKKLSRFSQRFTYKPPKAKTYGVVRVKETDHANLRQGLVGAWCPSLPNGGSGNMLPDLSGRGNNGQFTNMDASDWVSSGDGRALDFDGSNDVVEANRIDLVSTGTLAAWVKLAGKGAIIIKQSTTANQWDYAMYCATSLGNTRLYFYADNLSPTNSLVSPSQLSSDWTHVVGMKTATQILLYVNGSQVASASATNNFQQRDFKVYLGYDFRDPSVRGNMQLDDCRIYNRALTEPEIRLLASKRGIGLEPRKPKLLFQQFPSGSSRRLLLTGQT